MVDANLVLRQMEVASTKLNVVMLDACRNIVDLYNRPVGVVVVLTLLSHSFHDQGIILGWVLQQPLTSVQVLCIALIIGGAVGLSLSTPAFSQAL